MPSEKSPEFQTWHNWSNYLPLWKSTYEANHRSCIYSNLGLKQKYIRIMFLCFKKKLQNSHYLQIIFLQDSIIGDVLVWSGGFLVVVDVFGSCLFWNFCHPRSNYVVQTSLKFIKVHLTLSLKYWDYRHGLLHPAEMFFKMTHL